MPKARFIEPTDKLPYGPQWQHKLKFDGYRALAIKSGAKVLSVVKMSSCPKINGLALAPRVVNEGDVNHS